jgi:hypothetical protein
MITRLKGRCQGNKKAEGDVREEKEGEGEGGNGDRERKKKGVGNGLRSHAASSVVPSALVSLTTGFGMGPGVPSRL